MATTTSFSASPRARASRRARRRLIAGALAAAAFGGGARAQSAGEVIVIDMRRLVAESAAMDALRALEADERAALQADFDRLKAELETREAELVELRARLPKAEFDERVRAFDQRVRAERQGAQQRASALRERYAAADAALRRAVGPIVDALMRETGAVLALDAADVLGAAPSVDLTDEALARLDAELPARAAPRLVPAED